MKKELFARTWGTYKRRVGSILSVYAFGIIATFPLLVLVALLALPGLFFPPLFAVPALVFLAGAFVLGFGTQSMCFEAAMHDGMTWRHAFETAKKDWVRFAWASIAASLLLVGASGLFLIPALILIPAANLVMYAFKVEGKNGLAPLLHTHALIQGRWWKTLARLLVFSVLVGIVPFFLDLFSPELDVANTFQVEYVVSMILSLVSSAYTFFLAAPLSLVFGAELYHDLKSTGPHNAEHLAEASRGKWMALAIVGAVFGIAALTGLALVAGPFLTELINEMK